MKDQYIPDLTERFPEGFDGVDLTDSYFPNDIRGYYDSMFDYEFDKSLDDLEIKHEKIKSCLCGCTINGYGNDPYPLNKDEDAMCCDSCNMLVIQARLIEIYKTK